MSTNPKSDPRSEIRDVLRAAGFCIAVFGSVFGFIYVIELEHGKQELERIRGERLEFASLDRAPRGWSIETDGRRWKWVRPNGEKDAWAYDNKESAIYYAWREAMHEHRQSNWREVK